MQIGSQGMYKSQQKEFSHHGQNLHAKNANDIGRVALICMATVPTRIREDPHPYDPVGQLSRENLKSLAFHRFCALCLYCAKVAA